MSTRASLQKNQECSTTFWCCLFPENYEYVLMYQAKMRAKGHKRTSLPEVMNAIIKEFKNEK